jgi:hypothetical protein
MKLFIVALSLLTFQCAVANADELGENADGRGLLFYQSISEYGTGTTQQTATMNAQRQFRYTVDRHRSRCRSQMGTLSVSGPFTPSCNKHGAQYYQCRASGSVRCYQ